MTDINEKAPPMAVGEASKMHTIEDGTQGHHSKIISFPHHRRRSLLTLSERCRAWRSIRAPRGDYRTPLPGDLIEVRHA